MTQSVTQPVRLSYSRLGSPLDYQQGAYYSEGLVQPISVTPVNVVPLATVQPLTYQAPLVETIVRPPVQIIQRLEKKEAAPTERAAPGEDCSQYKKRIRQLEEELSTTNWDAKIRLLTEEINRLTEENEDLHNQMNMYKQKYVEFSNMTESLNNTMATFVLTCASKEALLRRLNEKPGEKRASVSEKLAAVSSLGGGGQSTRLVKVTEEYV